MSLEILDIFVGYAISRNFLQLGPAYPCIIWGSMFDFKVGVLVIPMVDNGSAVSLPEGHLTQLVVKHGLLKNASAIVQ